MVLIHSSSTKLINSEKKGSVNSLNFIIVFLLLVVLVTIVNINIHFSLQNDYPRHFVEHHSSSFSSHLSTTTTNSSSSSSPKIQIFYNLYIKDENDLGRVNNLVQEQLSLIIPELHHNDVYINSIGYNTTVIANQTITHHYEEGQEDLTLHALYEYCKTTPNPHEQKVVYLHSKGSYHDSPSNTALRQFVSASPLSKECANLPDQCNVCSTRMSPLPHPHSPGNMWLARCDYVMKLVDPSGHLGAENERFRTLFLRALDKFTSICEAM